MRDRDYTSSPDVDRGWAFVVMLCGSLSQALTLGLTYTSAIFYTTFLDEFQESPVFTAWTVNLNIFSFYLTGELSNALVGFVGGRWTIVIGCALSTVGLASCYFAQSLTAIFILYGVVTGIGFSCGYFPVFDVIASYFRKYRAVAFAVASAGTGLGQFMYPPLLIASIEAFHWRGAFLILAAVNLNMLVIAAVLMPPRQPPSDEMTTPLSSNDLQPKVSSHLRQQFRNLLLFRRPRWILFCVSLALSNVGISGFYTHISNFGRVLGFSTTQTTFLPSVVGIGAILGRVVAGSVSHIPGTHVVGIYIFFFALLGLANIALSLTSNYAGVVVGCSLCGLAVGAYGIYPMACIFVLGVSHLTTGMSYSTLIAALGMLLGGPLAARVYEADPSYKWSFVTVGLIALFGSLLNLPSCLTVDGGRVRYRPAFDEKEVESLEIDPNLDTEVLCSIEESGKQTSTNNKNNL